MRPILLLMIVLWAWLVLGCDDYEEPVYRRWDTDKNSSSDADTDGDTDSDTDTETDTADDTDSDTDTETDTADDTDSDTHPVLDAEAQGWLDAHNAVRHLVNNGSVPGQPQATPPMDDLAWDPLLAQVSQAYSENCGSGHNPNRASQYHALGGSGSVGENLWTTSSTSWSFNPTNVVDLWYSEYSLYTPWEPIDDTNYMDFGHYTQLVWRNTTHVGCGYAACPASGTIVTCNYAPAGNFLGQYPY